MPEDHDKKHHVALSREVREVRKYSGPVPSAEEFARYEEVLPGSADRLISMAEREQTDIVSFRNRVLIATTIVAIVTILAISYILTLNAYAFVVAAMAIGQALPAVTDFIRGMSDNRIAREEHELEIQIRKDHHELDMLAARQQLSLPSGTDDDSHGSPQQLSSESDLSNDKESSNRD